MHNTNCPIVRSVVSVGNSCKRMTCSDKEKMAGWSLSYEVCCGLQRFTLYLMS